MEAAAGSLCHTSLPRATATTTSCSVLAGLLVAQDCEGHCDGSFANLTPGNSQAGESVSASGSQDVHDLEAGPRGAGALARPPAPLYTVGRILACSGHSASGGCSDSGEYASPGACASSSGGSGTSRRAFLADPSVALPRPDDLLRSPAPMVFEKTVRGGAPRRLMPAAAAIAGSHSQSNAQRLGGAQPSAAAATAAAGCGLSGAGSARTTTVPAQVRGTASSVAAPAPQVWGSASFDATVSAAAAAAASAAASASLPHLHQFHCATAISAMGAEPTAAAAHVAAAQTSAAAAAASASASGGRPAAVAAVAGEDGVDGRCQSCPMAWPLHLLEAAGGVLNALVSPPDSGTNAFATGDASNATAPGAASATASPGGGAAAAASHLQQLPPVGSRRCRLSMEEALPEHPLLRLMGGAGSGGLVSISAGPSALPDTPKAATPTGSASGAAASSSFGGGGRQLQSVQPLQVRPHPLFGGGAGCTAAGTMSASEGLSWLLMSAEAADLAPAPPAAAGSSSIGASPAAKPGSSGGMAAAAVDGEAAARVVAALQPVMQELQAMRAEMGLLLGSGGGCGVTATAGPQHGASVSSGPWLASAARSGAGLVAVPARGAVSFSAVGGGGRALQPGGGSGAGSAGPTASDAAAVLSAVLSSLPDLEELGEPLPEATGGGSPQRHAAQHPHPHLHHGHDGVDAAAVRLQPRGRLLAGLPTAHLAPPASIPQSSSSRSSPAAGAPRSAAPAAAAAASAAASSGSSSSNSGGKASRRGRR
ncbi:hypothetical protein HXX76_014962 [Chlamydomonas incerta]|uniref:Uncharacterized protein n=1 Tax=Chlamydomonas incerta TaxID=51695 RepID=A0A835SBH0_CHLIN|nr:hypothetical protein HXX76_014962 [Chlamydomonas incerta]|eukprot:KAG2423909.1 hypothetical protein HXX76_014962 [Chlamydomonas incerta]